MRKLLKSASCSNSQSVVFQITELLICSEKTRLEDTRSDSSVDKDSNIDMCEELK